MDDVYSHQKYLKIRYRQLYFQMLALFVLSCPVTKYPELSDIKWIFISYESPIMNEL